MNESGPAIHFSLHFNHILPSIPPHDKRLRGNDVKMRDRYNSGGKGENYCSSNLVRDDNLGT